MIIQKTISAQCSITFAEIASHFAIPKNAGFRVLQPQLKGDREEKNSWSIEFQWSEPFKSETIP